MQLANMAKRYKRRKCTKQYKEIGESRYRSALVCTSAVVGGIPLAECHAITTSSRDFIGVEGETCREDNHIEGNYFPRFHSDTALNDTVDAIPVQRDIVAVETRQIIWVDDNTLASGCFKGVDGYQL